MKYVERTYRLLHCSKDLVHFQLAVKETDLDIAVTPESFNENLILSTRDMLIELRLELEKYIKKAEQFAKSFEPCEVTESAPSIARDMALAAKVAGVGPMAAVAGAFSQYIGKYLIQRSKEVIVENGGDIYIFTNKLRRVAVFAADSPFSQRIALEINPKQSPLGICTSSGTVGHSISFGNADAVVVLSHSAILADAVATAAANLVKNPSDLKQAVEFAISINGIIGALAIYKDKMAAGGDIKLVQM